MTKLNPFDLSIVLPMDIPTASFLIYTIFSAGGFSEVGGEYRMIE